MNMAPYLRPVLESLRNMAYPVNEINATSIMMMFLRSKRQDNPDKATVKDA